MRKLTDNEYQASMNVIKERKMNGLVKYCNMTEQERLAFYQKHNLSSHPQDDLIELARHDIEWCLLHNGDELEKGDLDWLIAPLEDLGETQLLNQVLEQKKRLDL